MLVDANLQTGCLCPQYSEHEIVQEPSSTRARGLRKLALNSGTTGGARKMTQNASKKPIIAPITQLLKLRTQNCCITGMSTKAGDELNLRHFHCLQTTVVDNNGHVNDLVQGLDDPDEPTQQGHHPRRITATAEPSERLLQPEYL